MGFFDICNDDPNLSSKITKESQKNFNNERSYTFEYKYSPIHQSINRTIDNSFSNIKPTMPDFTGLFSFDKNISHIYFFESPNIFSEYYINSTGKRCVSIGEYYYLANGCYLIRCADVRNLKTVEELANFRNNKTKNDFPTEIYISYTINFKDFFVAFRQNGDSLENRISNFVKFATTHYNWGSRISKTEYTLDEYEKMIIQKRLYTF